MMIHYNNNLRSIPFTQDQLDRLLSKYEGGQSTRSLAEEYGISQSAVRRRLVALGARVRPRGNPEMICAAIAKQAVNLRDSGVIWRDIERILGFSKAALSAHIRKIQQA